MRLDIVRVDLKNISFIRRFDGARNGKCFLRKTETTVFGEQDDGYERATKFVVATIVVKETFVLLYDYRKFRVLPTIVCIV